MRTDPINVGSVRNLYLDYNIKRCKFAFVMSVSPFFSGMSVFTLKGSYGDIKEKYKLN